MTTNRIVTEFEAIATSIDRQQSAEDRAAELAIANSALQRITDALAVADGLQEIIPTALRITTQVFGVRAAGYFETEDGGALHLRYWLMDGELYIGEDLLPERLGGGFRVPERYPGGDPKDRQVTGVIDQLEGTRERRFYNGMLQRGREIELSLPLIVQTRFIGELVLYRGEEKPFSEPEIGLAEALVKQLTIAVQAARLAEESRARAVEIAVSREREQAAQVRAAELVKTNESLLFRDRLLTATTSAIKRLFGSDDFESAVVEALGILGEAAQLNRVKVFVQRIEPETERLYHVLCHEWHSPELTSQVELGIDRFYDDEIPEYVAPMAAGRTLWHSIEEVSDKLQQPFRRAGMQSMAVVPLFVGAQYAGVVAFDDCLAHRAWTTAEIDALTIGAHAIGAGIHRRDQNHILALQREKTAQEQVAELANANRVLSQVNARLSKETDYDAALAFILLEISHFIGADAAMICRFDSNAGVYRFACLMLDGGVSPVAPSDLQAELDESYTAEMMPDVGKEILTVRIGSDDESRLPCLEWHKRRGHEVVAQCGLYRGDTPLGLLAVAFTTQLTLSNTALEMFNGLAQQATLALQLGRLADEDKMHAVAREQEQAVAMERARMAREIHDTLAQSFSGILLQLRAMECAQARNDFDSSRIHAERAAEFAQFGLTEARRSLSALRPAELEGRSLHEALRLIARTFEKRSGIKIDLKLDDDVQTRPQEEAELLRIVQESVANVLKHSGATRILIDLRKISPNSAELCVSDDGHGFDPDAATEGFGLLGMRERAGKIGATLKLESNQLGTSLCVLLHRKESMK